MSRAWKIQKVDWIQRNSFQWNCGSAETRTWAPSDSNFQLINNNCLLVLKDHENKTKTQFNWSNKNDEKLKRIKTNSVPIFGFIEGAQRLNKIQLFRRDLFSLAFFFLFYIFDIFLFCFVSFYLCGTCYQWNGRFVKTLINSLSSYLNGVSHDYVTLPWFNCFSFWDQMGLYGYYFGATWMLLGCCWNTEKIGAFKWSAEPFDGDVLLSNPILFLFFSFLFLCISRACLPFYDVTCQNSQFVTVS